MEPQQESIPSLRESQLYSNFIVKEMGVLPKLLTYCIVGGERLGSEKKGGEHSRVSGPRETRLVLPW